MVFFAFNYFFRIILSVDMMIDNNFGFLLGFIPFFSFFKGIVYLALVFLPEQPVYL